MINMVVFSMYGVHQKKGVTLDFAGHDLPRHRPIASGLRSLRAGYEDGGSDQNFDTNRTVDRVVPCLTTLGRLPRPPFFIWTGPKGH